MAARTSAGILLYRRSGGLVEVLLAHPGGPFWAVEGDLDPGEVVPGTFEMEWPKGSGRLQRFPEVDRVAWFDLHTAQAKLLPGLRPFLDRLRDWLGQ